MSALASLVRAYDRLVRGGLVPVYGYSQEKIGFVITIDGGGSPVGMPMDLRTTDGGKIRPPTITVPRPAKRSSGIAPNFLWDKTAYALGVTTTEGRRTREEHATFIRLHAEWLREINDPGLQAFLAFLERWLPTDFERYGWPEAMKDQNVVFALEGERLQSMLHDRPAARALWARLIAEDGHDTAICLITGERGPIARLHPSVKGVWGAQSSGASIISFNLPAFQSYGHKQGNNAPISCAAAFAYTTALNHFLGPNSSNSTQIGGITIVFWAEAADQESAANAEQAFASFIGIDGGPDKSRFNTTLSCVGAGLIAERLVSQLPPGVRFSVLGLAANAARLAVRFYFEDDFKAISERLVHHADLLRIQPPPEQGLPQIGRLLVETAVQGKSENILPLAAEWLRAILSGAPYPATLLTTLIIRLRADHDPNPLRVSVLKALLLSRHAEMDVPVSLDPTNKDPGYLLGRLFATYEYAQREALPGGSRTIRDRYYSRFSAAPSAVFALLQRKTTHHIATLRKNNPVRAQWLNQCIGQIFKLSTPDSLFVPTLSVQRQALFAIGYYHQRNDFYRSKKTSVPVEELEE